MVDQTVLIVEDDPKISFLLRNMLEAEGFKTLEADTARDALSLMRSHNVTLVTLDIHLGKDNGLEFAREIRRTSQVPIIMLTGKADVIDRVVGLEVGADDYITKPFHVREVLARIEAVLRRTQASVQAELSAQIGDEGANEQSLDLTFDGMVARFDHFELLGRAGEPVDLTSGDFKLLGVFLQNPKRVLSRDRLMNLLNGVDWSPLDRTIDNQVARLRRKIERNPSAPMLIKTVRGVGYVFAADVLSAL